MSTDETGNVKLLDPALDADELTAGQTLVMWALMALVVLVSLALMATGAGVWVGVVLGWLA